jgi:hypothetical protein
MDWDACLPTPNVSEIVSAVMWIVDQELPGSRGTGRDSTHSVSTTDERALACLSHTVLQFVESVATTQAKTGTAALTTPKEIYGVTYNTVLRITQVDRADSKHTLTELCGMLIGFHVFLHGMLDAPKTFLMNKESEIDTHL